MKIAWALIFVGLLGCTKHNPASCCTSAAQCASLGIAQQYDCAGSNVCDSSGTCVAPQCSTSADCAPVTPVCVGQLCVASCASSADCNAALPECGPGGACVECLDSSQCPSNAPVCSADSQCVVSGSGSDGGSTHVCTHELLFERDNLFTQGQVIRISLDDFIEHSFSDGTIADVDGSWSPDGTKVAFVRQGSNLWVMDRDGQNPHLVDTSTTAFLAVPEWSPDGTRLSYWHVPFSGGDGHIFVASIGGTSGTDITPTAIADGPALWSADGQHLIFQSKRTGDYDIFKVSPDGSNPVNLTNRAHDDVGARWSPDGAKIVFTGNGTVTTMNADGTGLTPLTSENDGILEGQASWGSDGKIYYVKSPTAGAQLYVMNSTGANQHPIDDNTALNQFPVLSPDGEKLAWFARRDANHFEIYVSDADGTHVTRVTNSVSSPNTTPKWRPCP